MERTTTREGELLPGREAEALCRLSRLETMMEDVLAEEARLSQQLSALRLEGKTKTARFREAVGASDPLRHDRAPAGMRRAAHEGACGKFLQ